MSNESKTTKAYKISPELKEKLERLAVESGLETQEAFIEQMAALYELQRLKEGNGSGYVKQIDELEYHTRRSVELFVGMINTEAAERLKLSQQHEETIAIRSATIFAQEQEIAELKKDAKLQSDELARIAKENDTNVKLVEQLQESIRDKGLIVDQRGQEIATLSGIVNEYKAAAEENRDLKTKVSEFTLLTDKQAMRITVLEDNTKELERIRVEELKQQQEKVEESMERLVERKDVEKERELLALRTEYQTKLEKINEDATAKIRELYEQMELQRTAHEQQLREIQQPAKKDPPQK